MTVERLALTAQGHYRVFHETLYNLDTGSYDTYGIVFENGSDKDCVHDIFTSEERVAHMADMFNQYGLALVHFHDAVADMLD